MILFNSMERLIADSFGPLHDGGDDCAARDIATIKIIMAAAAEGNIQESILLGVARNGPRLRANEFFARLGQRQFR